MKLVLVYIFMIWIEYCFVDFWIIAAIAYATELGEHVLIAKVHSILGMKFKYA